MPTRFVVRCLLRTALLAAGSSAPGCSTPPDVSAFSTATHSLAAAIHAGGDAVRSELELSAVSDQATRFNDAWDARNKAMNAASDYADSLVAVVAAANASGGAARTLAQSLQSFAQIAGVLQPGSANTASLATDTAAYIYAQIAIVRASRAIDDAVTNANPIVHRLAELMMADTDDLESTLRAAAAIRRLDLAHEFDEPLSFRNSLARRQSELRTKSYESLSSTEISELERLGILLAPVETQLVIYSARAAGIDTAEAAQIAMIVQTRDAINVWAQSHSALALALKEHRPFNADSLVDATLELRELIQRLHTMRSFN